MFVLGSYSQRTLGLGTLVSFSKVETEIDYDCLKEFYMYSGNLFQFGLDNLSSFSRDREWTNIKIGVHILLILSFFVIAFLINLLKVKENIFLNKNINKRILC